MTFNKDNNNLEIGKQIKSFFFFNAEEITEGQSPVCSWSTNTPSVIIFDFFLILIPFLKLQGKFNLCLT